MWHLLRVSALWLVLPLLSASARDIPRDSNATDPNQDLFPISHAPLKSWSMAPRVPGYFSTSPENFNIPSGLGPADPLTIVQGPDSRAPSPAIKATYGANKYGEGPDSGFSFYALGPGQVNLTTAKEVTMSYSVFFEDGFKFQEGGMLPGLCKCQSAVAFYVKSLRLYSPTATIQTVETATISRSRARTRWKTRSTPASKSGSCG